MTSNTLQVISPHSEWYRGGQSDELLNISKEPQVNIVEKFQLIGFDQEELELLNKRWTYQSLNEFIKKTEVAAQRNIRGSTYERMRSFLYSVSAFADRLSSIALAIPNCAEYNTALAVIAIMAKTISSKADMDQQILSHIDKIKEILPTIDYLSSAVQNAHMATAISGICSEITNYLYESIVYFRKPRLNKFVGAFITNFEAKFGKHVASIESHATTIRNLQSTVNLAVSLDTIEKLDVATRSLFQLLKDTNTLLLNMNVKIDENSRAISQQMNFTMQLHVQTLQEILLPEPFDADQTIRLINQEQRRLPPEERWDNRGFEEKVRHWLQREWKPLLWVSGAPRKNRTSFLSGFMVDLANALALEQDVGTAYIFLDTDFSTSITPGYVLRHFIVQIIRMFPEVVRHHADLLSASNFRKASSSTKLAHTMLYETLSFAKALPNWPTRGLFLLISGADHLKNDKDCHATRDFLPSLQKLALNVDGVNVILTSSMPVQSIPFMDTKDAVLASVNIDGPRNAISFASA